MIYAGRSEAGRWRSTRKQSDRRERNPLKNPHAKGHVFFIILMCDCVFDSAKVDDACWTMRATIHDVRSAGKGISTR
jgi:hypothetical protein